MMPVLMPSQFGDESQSQVFHKEENIDTGSVIAKLESILEPVLDSLCETRELGLRLASGLSNQGDRTYVRFEQVNFPGRNSNEARKFARVLLIMQLAHDALVSGTVMTKRHIFYQHQGLFKTQAIVDALVDNVALTLGVRRGDLGIVATSKGVVCGSLTIRLLDGRELDASIADTGTPIPSTKSIAGIDFHGSRWILVVEKDAVFRTLEAAKFWDWPAIGPGVIVTAKGYPDIITRSFVKEIHRTTPDLPIFALVDYDPDGLNIFKSYRYSSRSAAGEMAGSNPGICWLGVKTCHILELDATMTSVANESGDQAGNSQTSSSRSSIASTGCKDVVRQLTSRDRKLAMGTLERLQHIDQEDIHAQELITELRNMLMMGVKAEIEWLDESGNITDWLQEQIWQTLTGNS